MGPQRGVLSKTGLVRASLLALASVLCISWTTFAHRPLFAGSSALDPDTAPRITDPSVSHVIYFELESRGAVQWFIIENDKPREVPVQLGVPSGSSQGAVDPVLILFGPGFTDRPEGVAIDPPQGEGTGALALSRADHPERFHEPVTGTESLILVDRRVELPSSGTYYGAVFDGMGREGKVWVGLGRREGFRWRDILRLPGWIRAVREFHEVPGWPRWVSGVAWTLSAVVAVCVIWLVRRRRRA